MSISLGSIPKNVSEGVKVYDILTVLGGMTAATMVALAVPQPFFGIAFWFYVISAASAVYANHKRRNKMLLMMFAYYFIIDSVGVINWWPF